MFFTVDYNATVNTITKDGVQGFTSDHRPQSKGVIVDESFHHGIHFYRDEAFSASKKPKTRGIEKEFSSQNLIASEKPIVEFRMQDYLDRLTYYNNFKLTNDQYVDPIFQPNINMIFSENSIVDVQSFKKKLTFKRMKDVFQRNLMYEKKTPKFFQVYPSYFDFKSFNLLLHVIHTNRVILEKIFSNSEVSERGFYSLNLMLNNNWKSVQIDDYLPLQEEKLLCTSCSSGEPWPSMLEKALAKVAGSYSEMSTVVNFENLMRICTGCFSKKYFFDKDESQAKMFEYFKFWKGILKCNHVVIMKTNNKPGVFLDQNS